MNISGSQHGPANDLSDTSRHPRWLWFDRAACFALAIYGIAVLMTLLAAPH